jgi:phosphoglycolate phosphatase
MFGHLLCDLDGTLIDSAESIVESLRRCLATAGIEPRIPLENSLIGPPLRSLIGAVIAPADASATTAIEEAFRREYDSQGYRAAKPYPGVSRALRELGGNGVALHLVTNKRFAPTRSIITNLGWSDLFTTVDTLDLCPGAASKTELVMQLLRRMDVVPSAAALVGDSSDDARAAHANGLKFAWASWGYGSENILRVGDVKLGRIEDLKCQFSMV